MNNQKWIVATVAGVSMLSSAAAWAGDVHSTDVTVNGSMCVGMDCVSSESFGFDTLRLKENNLRINFLDTSSSGSFPSTDWRITINDSNNGGSNHFSVEDATSTKVPFRIEGGAPNNSLVVDSTGRIGIKTQTPAVEIHNADGDTPTLRLDQDGSSGWSPQIWDVAGNEANFFIRDVTHSSKLPFRIKPNAEANSIYVGTGSVGIGTASPDSTTALEVVKKSGDSRAILANGEVAVISDDPTSLFRFKNSTTGQTWRFTMLSDGAFQMKDQTNSGGALIQLNTDGTIEIRGDVDIEGNLTCNGGSC